jgi:Fe2+ transport system protein FeoA
MQSLFESEKNKAYVILKITEDNKNILTELSNLMIVVGSTVEIKQTNYGKTSLLIKSKNISYAIDCNLAKKIFVSEVHDE